MMSDRRKMAAFVSALLPDDEQIVVLGGDPSAPVTALLTKVGDDLEIASNAPEWVTLREVYDHFRWREMTSWEQRKLLEPARTSDLNYSINRLEELSEKFERRLASAGVGERQSRPGDQAMTTKDVAEFLGCSYCEARDRLLDGRIRAVRDGRWLRTRREWVEEYLANKTVKAASEEPDLSIPVPTRKRKCQVKVKKGGFGQRFLEKLSK